MTELAQVQARDAVAPLVGEAKPVHENVLRAKIQLAQAALSVDEAFADQPLASALADFARASDPAALRQALERVREQLETEEPAPVLERWLKRHARDWMSRNPARLATVIDAAVETGVPQLEELVGQILANADDESLLRVAARRARHLAFANDAHRLTAWATFRDRLGALADEPSVLPSAAHLGRTAAIPWLLERLGREDAAVASAAAIGLLDLASSGAWPPTDEQREEIAAAALERLNRGDNASPSVLWLLGSVCTPGNVGVLADALAERFVHGRRIEAAAAARAAGNLVRKDFTVEAIEALRSAVQKLDPSQEGRLLQLAIRRPDR